MGREDDGMEMRGRKRTLGKFFGWNLQNLLIDQIRDVRGKCQRILKIPPYQHITKNTKYLYNQKIIFNIL